MTRHLAVFIEHRERLAEILAVHNDQKYEHDKIHRSGATVVIIAH